MNSHPLRGTVWLVHLPRIGESKPFIIVSNNQRNKLLGTYLGVRITTTQKHGHFDSMVKILGGEPVVGTIICDDIEIIYNEDLLKPLGGLSPVTISRLEEGLKAALGMHY